MRLLLVDDDEQIRALTRRIVERAGVTVVGEAFDGAQALSFLDRNQVDAVVMDVEMPIMDGIEATSHISDSFPGLPVVLYTASGRPSMLDSGAVALVLKGSPSRDLVDVLKSLQEAAGG